MFVILRNVFQFFARQVLQLRHVKPVSEARPQLQPVEQGDLVLRRHERHRRGGDPLQPDLQDASGRQLSVRARESQKNDETAADRDLMTLRHELGSMRVLLERNLGRLVAQESPLATGDLAARLTSAGLGGVLQQRLRTVLPEQPDRETLAEAI